jgi:hypothetical protein
VRLLRKHTGTFEEAATKLLRRIENPFITTKGFEAVLGMFSRKIREVRKRWVMDDLLIQIRKELSK